MEIKISRPPAEEDKLPALYHDGNGNTYLIFGIVNDEEHRHAVIHEGLSLPECTYKHDWENLLRCKNGTTLTMKN